MTKSNNYGLDHLYHVEVETPKEEQARKRYEQCQLVTVTQSTYGDHKY